MYEYSRQKNAFYTCEFLNRYVLNIFEINRSQHGETCKLDRSDN